SVVGARQDDGTLSPWTGTSINREQESSPQWLRVVAESLIYLGRRDQPRLKIGFFLPNKMRFACEITYHGKYFPGGERTNPDSVASLVVAPDESVPTPPGSSSQFAVEQRHHANVLEPRASDRNFGCYCVLAHLKKRTLNSGALFRECKAEQVLAVIWSG